MRQVRITAGLAGVALVAYHGWLLSGQFADGRLGDPWLLARWILAAGLVGGLVAIRRAGSSLWNHKAVAIWVLAALLHGPAVVGEVGGELTAPALPEAVVTIVLQVAASGGLTMGLWVLVGLFARRDGRPIHVGWLMRSAALAGSEAAAFTPPFSPRPPPLL